MGLFDKKKKDDFDSPVEEVSLSKPAAKPEAGKPPGTASPAGAAPRTSGQMPAQAAPTAAAGGTAAKQPSGPPPAAAPAAASKPAPQPEPDPEYDVNFGINKAIELMRKMPKDPASVELVVTVVKTTLEAMNVKVPTIVSDASRKQVDIEKRIDVLKKEIAEHESEISHRQKEIQGLEADHAETTEVKERLILAEKLADKGKLSPPELPKANAAAQGQAK
jgi:hypothetical protein